MVCPHSGRLIVTLHLLHGCLLKVCPLVIVESDWYYSSYNLRKCSSKGQNDGEVQTKGVERWYGLNDQFKKKTKAHIPPFMASVQLCSLIKGDLGRHGHKSS